MITPVAEMIRSLIGSIQENAELTFLIIALFIAGAVWGQETFATQEDLKRALIPIQESIANLNRANLQQQRRELRSQIAEIHYAIENGTATDWQRQFLPELQSDLDDVQDAIDKLPKSAES